MRAALGVCLLAVTVGAARAQDTTAIARGTRVRATVIDGPRVVHYTGDVDAIGPDTLVLRVSGDSEAARVALDRRLVTGLRVSQGRRSSGQGWRHGAALGAGMGATTGLLVGLLGPIAAEAALSPLGDYRPAPGEAVKYAVGETLAGAAGGAVIGALVGLLHPGERWHTVDPTAVRLGIAPRAGGVGVGLRIGI